jgi:hypothetical protein
MIIVTSDSLPYYFPISGKTQHCFHILPHQDYPAIGKDIYIIAFYPQIAGQPNTRFFHVSMSFFELLHS